MSITMALELPSRITRSGVKKEVDRCSICMDEFVGRKKLHITKCNHTFHKSCFQGLVTTNCPCCRNIEVPTVDHQLRYARGMVKENKLALKIHLNDNRLDEGILKREICIAKGAVKIAMMELAAFKRDEMPYTTTLKRNLVESQENLLHFVTHPEIQERKRASKEAKMKVLENEMEAAWISHIRGVDLHFHGSEMSKEETIAEKQRFKVIYLSIMGK